MTRWYNVLHRRFEPIHGYRETYARIVTQRRHYGHIHDHDPPRYVQYGSYQISGIDGGDFLYESPY